jgi:hypothetical protein
MKHRFLLLVGILALLVAPTVVSAQALLPGLPNMGKVWDMSKIPDFAPPTFFVGYSNRETTFSQDFPTFTPAGTEVTVKHAYEQPALALGVQEALPLDLFDGKVAVLGSWWVHLPLSSPESDEDNFIGVAGDSTQSWDTDSTWWWVDGIAAYMFTNNFAGLLGFRYEEYVASFDDPSQDALFPLSNEDMEADVTSNGYVPLVGVLWTYNGARTKMNALVVGIPTVVGNVEYNQTTTVGGISRVTVDEPYIGGHFLEGYFDYRYNMWGSDIGAFFRYNTLYGKWEGEIETNVVGGGDPIVDDGELGTIYRSAWTVGATINVPFNLNMPFM